MFTKPLTRAPRYILIKLQNSPYLCVFKYATREQSNKRSETRLKTESETWGETLIIRFFFFLASHALRACEARALRARKTLTVRFTDFFSDFEKKTDCFAVYILIKSFFLAIGWIYSP